MANPFGSDTVDYGTVSGQSSGFRSDGDFISTKERIGNLVLEIKQNSQKLRLDEVRIGTPSDTEEFRGKLQNLLRKTLGKVQNAKTLFSQLTSMAQESNDRGQTFAVKSLKQTLTSAVNEFQEASQDVWRELENAGDPARTKVKNRHSSPTFSDAAEVSDHHDRARLLRDDRHKQERQEQVLMVSDDAAHMEQRAERMGQIENDIVTLNDIMGQIGGLVMEQGEQIDHIETNVENAYSDVTEGNKQLEKGVKLKRCSRRLICVISSIVGVVALIIVIIIIIVAVQLKGKNKN